MYFVICLLKTDTLMLENKGRWGGPDTYHWRVTEEIYQIFGWKTWQEGNPWWILARTTQFFIRTSRNILWIHKHYQPALLIREKLWESKKSACWDTCCSWSSTMSGGLYGPAASVGLWSPFLQVSRHVIFYEEKLSATSPTHNLEDQSPYLWLPETG